MNRQRRLPVDATMKSVGATNGSIIGGLGPADGVV
jgi:hypothetical protein